MTGSVLTAHPLVGIAGLLLVATVYALLFYALIRYERHVVETMDPAELARRQYH